MFINFQSHGCLTCYQVTLLSSGNAVSGVDGGGGPQPVRRHRGAPGWSWLVAIEQAYAPEVEGKLMAAAADFSAVVPL